MPFLAPSFARMPPLSFLLADQTEPRKNIARHLGVSLRTLQRYQASSGIRATERLVPFDPIHADEHAWPA